MLPSPKLESSNRKCRETVQKMKRGGPALRKELDDICYLESHPEVCQLFKDIGCYRFCEKIQGSHQQVAKYFSLTFDGRKEVIDKEEL